MPAPDGPLSGLCEGLASRQELSSRTLLYFALYYLNLYGCSLPFEHISNEQQSEKRVMDPVSLVGLAASLSTLTGVFASGVESLWALAHKLKNAPEELKRIRSSLDTLRDLFARVESLLSADEAKLPPSDMNWKNIAEQILRDLNAFDAFLEKCCPAVDSEQRKWHVKARVKKYLNDGAIAHWESVFTDHINKSTLFLMTLLQ